MKKNITVLAHVGSLIVLLAVINAPMLLLRFIMVGELPGGVVVIPASTMLGAILFISLFMAAFYTAVVIHKTRIKQVQKPSISRKRFATLH